jgi:hypothetical protein
MQMAVRSLRFARRIWWFEWVADCGLGGRWNQLVVHTQLHARQENSAETCGKGRNVGLVVLCVVLVCGYVGAGRTAIYFPHLIPFVLASRLRLSTLNKMVVPLFLTDFLNAHLSN